MSARTGGEELWVALADPTRRRVLDLIVVAGVATPTSLARELPFTRQAVAKHLAVLEEAGLVEGERVGREVRYRVRADRLEEATQAMAAVASHWSGRLAALKRFAEAEHRGRTSEAVSAEPEGDARRP